MIKSNRSQNWFFWIGLLIVIGTHLYMLVLGLPVNQAVPHAIINLVAAGLLVYAWRAQRN